MPVAVPRACRLLTAKGDFVDDVCAFVDVIVIAAEDVGEGCAPWNVAGAFDADIASKPAGAGEALDAFGEVIARNGNAAIEAGLRGGAADGDIGVWDRDALIVDHAHLKEEGGWQIGESGEDQIWETEGDQETNDGNNDYQHKGWRWPLPAARKRRFGRHIATDFIGKFCCFLTAVFLGDKAEFGLM